MNQLNHLPIFQGLPETELQWLLDHGQTLDLAKGDFLMCEGDPSPRFYITLAGELQITRTIGGQEMVRGTTPPGNMAGEISTCNLSPAHPLHRASAGGLCGERRLISHSDTPAV